MDAPEPVSAARWAGVTIVVGALVAAIVLAVASPVGPGTGTGTNSGGALADVPMPTPSDAPSASPVSVGAPGERPIITDIEEAAIVDEEGITWTREREVTVSASVPETALRPRDLRLEVLVEGQTAGTLPRPRGEVSLPGVRLAEGRNRVTLRLASESGPGPTSEPLLVMLDTTAPSVTLRSPRNDAKLTGDTITVAGESEVGARVTIRNRATGDEKSETLGPAGTFEKVVRAAKGSNEIVVSLRDAVGNVSTVRRKVTNAGTRVAAQLSVRPGRVRVASLPTRVAVRARIADAAGVPIKGADVALTLSVPGDQPTQSFQKSTDADGQVVWQADIPRPVTAGEPGTITLVARLPDGRRVQKSLAGPAFD